MALGQANYQVNSQRDKEGQSFDVKFNWALSDNDQLSYRLSYQRPEVVQLPAEGYGDWGGPLGSGFMATGVTNMYSTAVNWTRTLSNTFIMESRGGLSYYRNEALHTAYGQDLAQSVGINGVNLDEWSSGPTTININNGFTNPALGYSASLPWDRWERTWQFAVDADQAVGQPHGEVRRRLAAQLRHAAADAGQPGPARRVHFQRRQTASPTDTAANAGIANAFASFLLDRPSGIGRDLKVIDEPGTKHWATFLFVHDKWQVSKRITADLGLRWEYYDPMSSLAGKGGLSNYDPATNTLQVSRLRQHREQPRPTEGPEQLGAAPGPHLPPRREDGDPRRLRRQHDAVPGQFLRVQLPGEAEQRLLRAEHVLRRPVPWLPASRRPSWPASRRTASSPRTPRRSSAQSYFYVPADLEQGTLHSWNVAFQRELFWGLTGEVAYVGNRSNDILYRFNINAGMTPGLDRAGQPLFKLYGKTAEVGTWRGRARAATTDCR